MVAVRYNRPSMRRVNYTGGSKGSIDIQPGITLGIDPKEWKAIARHPIIKALIADKMLEVISDPKTSEMVVETKTDDGKSRGIFQVVDDPRTGQPMPAINVGDRATVGLVAQPSFQVESPPDALALINGALKASELKQLPSIGLALGEHIIENRPPNGYLNFAQLTTINASLTRADWEAIAEWKNQEDS